MKRKNFLQSILGATTLLGMPFNSLSNENAAIQEPINNTKRKISGSMFGFATNPIKKVKIGIICLGNRGTTLLEMLQYFGENETVEVSALSDIKEENEYKVNKPRTNPFSLTKVVAFFL